MPSRRTPGAGITNVFDAIVDPTVNDDETQALDVGSWWFNVAAGRAWGCVDNAAGAAIWERVDQPKVNPSATVGPTSTDDETAGYEVASFWVDTVAQISYICVDATAGAAIWKSINTVAGSHPVTIQTRDPLATDDNGSGYEIGDHWINTASTPPRIWQALSVVIGAAVWERVSNRKDNTTALVDPTVTDDETANYEVGSIWINTVTGENFTAASVATGAAQWIGASFGASPAVNVGELMYGTLLDYPSASGQSAGVVYYIRIKLGAGFVIDHMRTFIDSGGTPARNVRMGIYDQVDPADPEGEPNVRVAQTAAFSTGGTNGTFIDGALLGGNYTIDPGGYYWLAVIADSSALKFAVSLVARADFLPLRQEVSTGTVLPATAGVLTNPSSSVTYVAGIEA